MAEGTEAYQGKLLEARQSDWKDEAVLIILSLPVVGAGLGSRIGRSHSDGQGKIVFRHVLAAPVMVYKSYGSLSWRAFMV